MARAPNSRRSIAFESPQGIREALQSGGVIWPNCLWQLEQTIHVAFGYPKVATFGVDNGRFAQERDPLLDSGRVTGPTACSKLLSSVAQREGTRRTAIHSEYLVAKL